jgi:hypothetical protein
MKHFGKIAVLAVALMPAMTMRAQDTVTEFNGTNWQRWTHRDKVVYVAGLTAGLLFGTELANGDVKEMGNNLTMEQTVVAVDQCYGDERNTKLPIFACWAFAAGQSKGLTLSELDAHMVEMRKLWIPK